MPDSSGSVDLGSLSQAEQEAVEKLAEAKGGDVEPDDSKPKVLTAFTVVVGYDGNPEIVQYDGEDILLQSNPTSDLIYAACSVLMKDMQAYETAQTAAQLTAQHLAQQAQAMQQRMADAQLHQQVGKGLRV